MVKSNVGPLTARRRDSRGNALLETALTMIVFLTMILGMFELAHIMFVQQTLVERVRGASRAAAVHGHNADTLRNLIIYRNTTATGTPLFGLQPSNIAVAILDHNSPEQRVAVTVSGLNHKLLTPLFSRTFGGIPVKVTVPLEEP